MFTGRRPPSQPARELGRRGSCPNEQNPRQGRPKPGDERPDSKEETVGSQLGQNSWKGHLFALCPRPQVLEAGGLRWKFWAPCLRP